MVVVCRFLEIRVVGVIFCRRNKVIQLDDFLRSTFRCRLWVMSSGVVSMIARRELAVRLCVAAPYIGYVTLLRSDWSVLETRW